MNKNTNCGTKIENCFPSDAGENIAVFQMHVSDFIPINIIFCNGSVI
jgi:hypothetical protein